jgi:excisionase family DNA binding protein
MMMLMNPKKVAIQPEAQSPEDEESYLKIGQAAKIINCSQTSCYRLVRAGAIPSFTYLGMVRIPRSALHAWLKANTHEPSLAGLTQPGQPNE